MLFGFRGQVYIQDSCIGMSVGYMMFSCSIGIARIILVCRRCTSNMIESIFHL
jgi:hypothetical protein